MSEPPAQTAPSSRAKSWPGVARAGEGVDVAALRARDLGDDVRGRAEAVEPQRVRVSCEPQRARADEARAQQRRRGGVGVRVGQCEAEALVGDGELGEAAVDVVAGEAARSQRFSRPDRQNLHVPHGPTEPRHAHAVADREPVGTVAGFRDDADDLVAGDERRLRTGRVRRRRCADRSGTPRTR